MMKYTKFSSISYAVIGVFIFLVICYQFIGTSTVGYFHSLLSTPNNYVNTIQCTPSKPNKVFPNLPNELLNNPVNQPLLFPFPKVFFHSSVASSTTTNPVTKYYLNLKSQFEINVNANNKAFDDRLTNIALNRFCDNANSFVMEGAVVDVFTIEEINVSIADLEAHSELVSADVIAANKKSSDIYRRQLSEMLLDESLVIQNEDDEFYDISIAVTDTSTGKSGAVKIQCNTEKGLLLALSTLNQLLSAALPMQVPFTLLDWPDNNWRGVLVDVSRHFQPVNLLKRTISAMEASKLNILHLHLTDAQSFPLLLDDVSITVKDQATATTTASNKQVKQVLKLSDLARKSAFSAEKMYTKDDMRELLTFAYERGVTIIPEIDMPAHTHSWNKAFEGIIVNCTSVARRSQTPLNIYPLDPSNPLTLVVIEEVLRQVIDLFDHSQYIHVGGDEVDEACWAEIPRVVQWSKDNNVPIREITKYFEREIFKIVYKLNRVPVVWQGILDGKQMPEVSEYDGSATSVNKTIVAKKTATSTTSHKKEDTHASKTTTTATAAVISGDKKSVELFKSLKNTTFTSTVSNHTHNIRSPQVVTASSVNVKSGNNTSTRSTGKKIQSNNNTTTKPAATVSVSASKKIPNNDKNNTTSTSGSDTSKKVKSNNSNKGPSNSTTSTNTGNKKSDVKKTEDKKNDNKNTKVNTNTNSSDNSNNTNKKSSTKNNTSSSSKKEESVKPASRRQLLTDSSSVASNVAAAGSSSSSTNRLPSPPVVEPWKCWDGLAQRSAVNAVQQGHPVVMSACWYLDYNQDWTTFLAADLTTSARSAVATAVAHASATVAIDLPSRQSGGLLIHNHTQKFSYTPGSSDIHQLTPAEVVAITSATTATAAQHQDIFLGGEAPLWAELVDHTNFECRLHPRLGAVAARLWGLGSEYISVSYTPKHFSSMKSLSPEAVGAKKRLKRMVASGGHQSMALTLDQSRLLYMSFIHYRFYLVKEFGVKAAELLFHYPKPKPASSAAASKTSIVVKSGVNSSVVLRPVSLPVVIDDFSETMSDEIEALRRAAVLSRPMNISTNDKGYNILEEGTFRITAQCRGMPEPIQRPLTSKTISFAQINIANGGSNSGAPDASGRSSVVNYNRGTKLSDWLTQHANKGTLFVGFNELNGWDELYSKTELLKNKPKMVLTAAQSGFTYSHVMASTSHPYSLGLVAAVPFTVIHEYKADSVLIRGVLHVFFPVMGIHVLIVHLSPKSAAQRSLEVDKILEIIAPLLKENMKVVVMGDFNTLSPYDQLQHQNEQLVELFKRTDQEIYRHFGAKYLNDKKMNIDYSPMEKLLNAELSDICVEKCIQDSTKKGDAKATFTSVSDKIKAYQWQINTTTTTTTAEANKDFVECMRSSCALTEPTKYNPEWPFKDVSHPQIRVDFILVSKALLTPSGKSNTDTGNSDGELIVAGGVDVSELTSTISDHFPVFASLRDNENREFEMFRV